MIEKLWNMHILRSSMKDSRRKMEIGVPYTGSYKNYVENMCPEIITKTVHELRFPSWVLCVPIK